MPFLAHPSSEDQPVAPERAARTNLFLAATLEHDGREIAVRVRNISVAGARIEDGSGVLRASPGSQVLLRRGELSARAKVAWCRDGCCGLIFDQRVEVLEWRASLGNPRKTVRAVPLVEDVRLASDLVARLSATLLEEEGVAQRLGDELQSLDLLAQLLAGIEARVNGATPALDGVRSAAKVMTGRRA